MHQLNRFTKRSAGFLLASSVAATGAQATTYTVNNNGDPASGTPGNCTAGNASTCTLRDAIAAAVGGDTINFDPSVTTISLAATLTLSDTTGSLITIDGGGTVTLDWSSTVPPTTVLQNVYSNTLLRGLTISEGYGYASQSSGGIYNRGTLELENCTLSGNSSKFGSSAIYNKAILVIGNSTISGNTAQYGVTITNSGGGGLSVYHSTISGNSAQHGATIVNGGELSVYQSTISGNVASPDPGGGVINDGAGAVTKLVDSTLSANGGGIYNSGALTLVGSTLSAVNGGISNGSTLTLVNSTVAAGYFSIVNVANASLTNVTVSGNISNSAPGTLNIANTILGTCTNSATLNDNGGNLDGGTSCLGATPASSTSKSNANLALGPLQNNGGPTQTMLPAIGSDAIDAGVDATCDDRSSVNGVDQRGIGRPQGAHCDSGAVERTPTDDRIFANGFNPPPPAAIECSGVAGYSDYFIDDFAGTTLDGSRWTANDNNANGGSITMTGNGVALQSAGAQFPFVTAVSPIPPTGNFSVHWRSRYANAAPDGDGSLVLWRGTLPVNGQNDDYSYRLADLWQDNSNGLQVRARTTDAGTYDAVVTENPPQLLWHDVEYCWLGSSVEIWVDGTRSLQSSTTGLTRPDSLWFGNPVLAGPSWNGFTLDYVHVRSVMP